MRSLLPLPAVAALAVATPARADEAPHGPEPRLGSPYLAWAIAQAIPSPEIAFGDGVHAGMRWQITPLLLAFGLDGGVQLRAFVVDPMARHAGSVEIVLTPEYLGGAPHGRTGWIARAGARAYWPLLEKGETLSIAVGGSVYRAGDRDGASVEAGIFTLFGIVGALVTVSPALSAREVVATLNLRYF